jgi:hypothetical protein
MRLSRWWWIPLVVGLAFIRPTAAPAQVPNNVLTDVQGKPWPCQFTGSSGAPTVCGSAAGSQLPVGNSGPPTQSTTDPSGFGKATFFGTGPSLNARALGEINTGCSPIACPSGERGFGAGLMFDELNAVAVGGDLSFGQLHIYRTIDAGINWFASADLTNTNGVSVTPGDCHTITPVANARNAIICGASIFFTSDFNSVTTASPNPTNGIAGSSLTQGATWIVLTANPGGWCRASTAASGFTGCTAFTPATTVNSNGGFLASPAAGIWIALANNLGAPVIFRSTDDGVTFTNTGAAIANYGTQGAAQIQCISATVCLIAMDTGTGSNIYRSADAGATWSLVYTTSTFHNLAAIANYGNGVVSTYLPASVTSNLAGNPAGLRSQDFGQTWAPIAPFTQSPLNAPGGQTNIQGSFGFAPVLVSPSGGNTIVLCRCGYATGGGHSIVPYYSRAVGAGSTIIAGENGSRLLINPDGSINATQFPGQAGGKAPWTSRPQLGQTLKTAAQGPSGANAAQTLSLTGGTGTRVCVYSIALYSSAAGAATLVIQSATTTSVKYDLGTITTAAQAVQVPLGAAGFCGVVGENVSILVGAAGGTATTTVSAIADQQ